jgi:hypothetical protein
LEGLEISEVKFLTACELSKDGRIDSNFYQRRFVKMRLKAKDWLPLKSVSKAVECGPFGSNLLNTNYVDAGIPMIRPFNLRKCRSDDGEIALLSEQFLDDTSLSTFGKDTVFFARVGEIGVGANVFEKATISPNIIAATVPDEAYAKCISIFAATTYGSVQLEAEVKAVAQPTISTDTVREFKVPGFSKCFRQEISETYSKAEEYLKSASQLTRTAEQTLLTALGLEDWQPPNPLTYESPASTAFTSNRLDAEFFRPKIKELYSILNSEAKVLSHVVSLRKERFKKKCDAFNYLEIGSVTQDGVVEEAHLLMKDAPSRATWLVEKDDVVTSTVRPIRGLTAIIQESQHGAVASSGFAVLKPDKISPELLMTYLKLPVICELMDLHTSASMYPSISVEDILASPFKHPGSQTEEKIIRQVRESRTARQKSKLLLERAKRAVEMAIEEDEVSALAYLGSNPTE